MDSILASKQDSNKLQNIIFYSLCALYVLSLALFVCDITGPLCALLNLLGKPIRADSLLHIAFIQTTLLACCDFIAQFILIYRCWIVWGCKFRVVVIPTLLTFAFLAPRWEHLVIPTSLALPLAVNTLVTGLIVFRIFKVFREVKATSDNQILGATGGNKFRSVIFILIESGMTLFSIQAAWLVLKILGVRFARAYYIVNSTYDMLTGITPTIILVRTSLGLSFHDEKSMEEAVIGSLRFAPNDSNPVPETGSIGMPVGQDSRDGGDIIEVRRSNDIEVVDR